MWGQDIPRLDGKEVLSPGVPPLDTAESDDMSADWGNCLGDLWMTQTRGSLVGVVEWWKIARIPSRVRYHNILNFGIRLA